MNIQNQFAKICDLINSMNDIGGLLNINRKSLAQEMLT